MVSKHTVTRREFVGATSGIAAVAGTAGVGTAQQRFDGFLSDVGNYDGVVDRTGQESIEVLVGADGNGGNFAFEPAAVQVDPGTEIVWQWTGEGGGHNVHAVEGADFNSGEPVADADTTYTQTVDETGVIKYQCDPHVTLGMKGVIVVGDALSNGGGGEDDGDGSQPTEMDPEEMGVPFQPHYVGIATILMMVLTLLFTFFLVKYGESSHARHGNER